MDTTEQLQQTRGGASTCPPWLQAAIADIEQRVRSLSVSAPDDKEKHSFAERAENYYQKRPQLLTLLTDLHHRYLYLADRYSKSLAAAKQHGLQHSNTSTAAVSEEDGCSSEVDDRSSDAGSSLSFQFLQPLRVAGDDGSSSAELEQEHDEQEHEHEQELMVAELVMAWVDRDVLADEAERRRTEATRKIELQGSLVEVLESERLVLLGENARLGFRASAAEEEAAAAAAELGYMRRRAAEMARLVVRLREDHRVCMLGRKIEALQAQVYGLELRNRECYETMAAWEAERKVGAAEMERLRAENRRLAAAMQYSSTRRRWWWWSRVRLAAEEVRKVGDHQHQHQQRTNGSKQDGKNYSYYGGCFCV